MRGAFWWVFHLLLIGSLWNGALGQYLEGTLEYEAALESGSIKLQTELMKGGAGGSYPISETAVRGDPNARVQNYPEESYAMPRKRQYVRDSLSPTPEPQRGEYWTAESADKLRYKTSKIEAKDKILPLEGLIGRKDPSLSEFFSDLDVYTTEVPNPLDYRVGLLVEPCKDNDFDCCDDTYGTPEYGLMNQAVDDDPTTTTGVYRKVKKYPLAGADEVSGNYKLVDEDQVEINSIESRLADDMIEIDDECNGVNDPHSYCQGFRKRQRRFDQTPACQDNNQTVYADRKCTDVNGNEEEFCVQVAYSQTALNVLCDGEFKNDPHCGTYLEVHVKGGSFYDVEDFVISEKKIDKPYSSGYSTTTLPLTYGEAPYGNSSIRMKRGPLTNYQKQMKKILCKYVFDRVSLGTTVVVKESAPRCCCPNLYTDAIFEGHFFCPRNTIAKAIDGYEGGPFAPPIDTLAEKLQSEIDAVDYPYCPYVDEREDRMVCSRLSRFPSTDYEGCIDQPENRQDLCKSFIKLNELGERRVDPEDSNMIVQGDEEFKGARISHYSVYASGPRPLDSDKHGNRYFTEVCPPVDQDNTTKLYGNEYLRGEYGDVCPYFDACGQISSSRGEQICNVSNTDDRYSDFDFSFAGLVGKVTEIPDDVDKGYFMVSFNDGRTSYPFLARHLQVDQGDGNYELWFVQRTRHNYIVRKKKPFRVLGPACTYDPMNERYLPYAIVRKDQQTGEWHLDKAARVDELGSVIEDDTFEGGAPSLGLAEELGGDPIITFDSEA